MTRLVVTATAATIAAAAMVYLPLVVVVACVVTVLWAVVAATRPPVDVRRLRAGQRVREAHRAPGGAGRVARA